MPLISQRLAASVLVPDFWDKDARSSSSGEKLHPHSYGFGLRCLCVNRKDNPEQWSLPGGKADPGESLTEAASRELFEETGIKVRPSAMTPVFSSLDSTGWMCTTFMVPHLDELDSEGTFRPEAGQKVAWVSAVSLRKPDISPFAAYHRNMFDRLGIVPACYEDQP